ncbi:MAG: PP2C family protein-serine/threonine phosphatase [Candidatus Omnitrophota bacterium]
MKSVSFKTKINLVFFTCYIVLFFGLISLFYAKAIDIQKENLREKLMELAVLGTRIVSAELVESIVPVRASMKTREYQGMVDRLDSIMSINPEIADVYVLVSTSKPGVMKFVANGDVEEPIDCGEDFDVTPYPELMKAIEWPSADREPLADRWGLWLSGYAPIKKEDGTSVAVLGVDISAETVAQMKSAVRLSAMYIFSLGFLLSIAASNLISWWLTKPLGRLVKGMEEIRSGNLNHKINLGTADEWGRLGENFNAMAFDLKDHIRNITEITAEKERLNRELEIAAELQQAILPQYTLDVKELDMAGVSLPARQVGGDYFDYIDREDGHNIGFVIADATGKGLPSSIFMTNSKSIFKVITTGEESPAKVIQNTNDQVIKDITFSSGMFTTMFYGIYDKDKRVFRYCNAGHNPPLFVDKKNSRVSLLSSHGCPVGIMEDQVYGESEINLSEGDTVILYTDGVVEALDKNRQMFGLQRLMKIGLDSVDLSAQEIVEKIKDSVFDFAGTQSQFDDLTLLVFRVK